MPETGPIIRKHKYQVQHDTVESSHGDETMLAILCKVCKQSLQFNVCPTDVHRAGCNAIITCLLFNMSLVICSVSHNVCVLIPGCDCVMSLLRTP